MKFSVLQENLSKGLNIISRAISAKPPMPILSNVLIQTDDGRIRLSATNLETSVTTYVEASVEKNGATTVPAKTLKDFITNLSPNTLTAILEEDVLHVHSQKTKSKFNGINADDYPALPKMPKNTKFIEVNPKDFAHALSTVSFSAGSDSSRPIFTGIYLKSDKDKLIMVATDGYRLSEKMLNLENGANDFCVVIPAKILAEVGKTYSDATSNIKILLDENSNLVLFESGDTMIATRIIDGQYPNYKAIIPAETKLKASFSTQDLLEAVRLTSVFQSDENKNLRMSFDPKGLIIVKSLGEETGQHESDIEAEIECGDVMDIAFSSKYLMDFLSNIKSERTILEATGSVTASIWKDTNDNDFLHLIMPVQI